MRPGELLRRLRYLLLRDRYAADLEEEIRTHIDHRAASLRANGYPPAEARYEAKRRFGNPVAIEERSRDMWGLTQLEHVAADLRFAVRRLRRRPGFSFATIAVAALGIGATTAVFSAIDAALIRPLPFPNPSELFVVQARVPLDVGVAQPQMRHRTDINDIAAMSDVVASVAVYAAGALNFRDADNPLRIKAGVVSRDFFATFGAQVQLGRTFDSSEVRPHGPHVAILSDAFWRDHFGGRDVLARAIDLNGNPYTVIGVMAPGFNFPNQSDVWIPLTNPTTFDSFSAFRGSLPTRVIVRAKPGLTPQLVSNRVVARWIQLAGPSVPGNQNSKGLDDDIAEMRLNGAAFPLQEGLVGDRRAPLALLMGATIMLLLIACANVANLLLADAAARRREVALREVLGASRGRVRQQLLTESLVLALAGATLGIALAPMMLGLLSRLMPANLAGVAAAELNWRVLAFGVVLAVGSSIMFGLWPALTATRASAAATIKSGGGLNATSGSLGRARRAIIVTELALTIMLLIGAGLMLRSFERVISQDRGIQSEHVATLELAKSGSRAARLVQFHAMLSQLEGDPSIDAAAIVNDLPLSGATGMSIEVKVDGVTPKLSVGQLPMARYLQASGGYFKALGIPLLRGRVFTSSDDAIAPPVAIINMAMAKAWWPNRDPIGQTFVTAARAPVTIIGIVGDLRERSLEGVVQPQMYFSIDDATPSNLALVARSKLPQRDFLQRLRAVVRTVDPTQAVYNVRMMDDVIASSLAPRRTNTTLIALFGAIALLLSVFGIYAVVSHSVTLRAREFGIRAALGATASDIVTLVGRELIVMLGIGLGIGLAGAWILSRVIATLLYGVEPHDPATFLIVPAVLVIPALIAGWPPARRAMGVSPVEVMRAE
ncbi:MAG TPA: ABC transporter permease [Gemmatimonadaceae bacterium]|jgi:predicted permease